MTKRRQKGLAQKSPSSDVIVSRGALVDIVVPIYGRPDLLKPCFDAIPAAIGDLKYNLTVIDDGTPDDSVTEALKSFDLPMRKLRAEQNKGYPAAVNACVVRGSAPIIIVLTTDVVMQPDSLYLMVKELDDPEVGVVGPKLIFPKDTTMGPPERIQHAGIAFDISGKPFHIFIGWQPDHHKVNYKREVSAVTGACFATRRNLWIQTQGLNEVYGKGTFEDMEYCFIVRKQLEKKVIYLPEAWGYHFVGASAGQGYPLGRNSSIFRANVGGYLEWDEWRHW